ncbi:hypothetical protein ONZ45_g11350 [Pleurotus djamor]|nr:hypothetical protein ONZ45_g11350 [Pleurotus djamor]
MATSPVPSTPSTAEETEGRNLVLSIDGTANEFSHQNTNVVELCRILIRNETQLTYYTSGIGTFADPHNTIFGKMKEKLETALEMVTARHFERKIFAAYQWLSENYKPGDRIYLFGFSRGAYFVRVLAGMIKTVGLLHKGNNDQIPFAFKLYSHVQEKHRCTMNGPDSKSKFKLKFGFKFKSKAPISTDKLCERYKAAFSHVGAQVHFVGAWDTVSSVGFVRKSCLPATIGMDHVTYFRHALALDEWRVKFVPEYTHRCDALAMEQSGDTTPSENTQRPKEERKVDQLKEVWFRGCHADIGGANNKTVDVDNDRPSLRWMISEAQQCGLKFDLDKLPEKGTEPSTYINPPAWWKLLEWLPIRRVTHGFHKGRSRTVRQGHQIHSSVRDAMDAKVPITDKAYVPKARLCKEGPTKEDQHKHVAIKGVEDIEQLLPISSSAFAVL